MQQFLDQLNSRKPEVSEAALREARALPPDAFLQLVLLEDCLSRARRRRGNVVYYVTMGLLTLLFWSSFGIWYEKIMCLICATFTTLGSELHKWYKNKYSRATTHITSLLLEVEDVRFVAQMLRLDSEHKNGSLRTVLKRLLPQVRADHAAQWSKDDKATLLLPLKEPEKDKGLTLCCLKALEQVGDASAVPAVKKLIDKIYPSNSSDSIAIAAQECLLYLESNSGKLQQAQTLLRSSEAACASPEILLRPASGKPDTREGEQLLRPGE